MTALNVKFFKFLVAISAQTCGKHIYCTPPQYQIYTICCQGSNLPAYYLKETFSPASVCAFPYVSAVMVFPTSQKDINILTHDKEANGQSISATNLT
jgi:hypothetical protein